MYERRRNLVIRPDGRLVNVARPRGQLFVCHNNCCCGRVEDGFAPVPADLYHEEWERRRLRNIVHLTIGGCLGPCALANVVLLLFDGQALWFHSVNHPWMVYALYDYIEAMLDADRVLPPPRVLAPYWFTASAWQPRPDGQPVDDRRLRRRRRDEGGCRPGHLPPEETAVVERVVAQMDGKAALPRKNGELVFAAPWQGRAFGMAVALHERGLYEWEEFRQELIRAIAEAERSPEPFDYYACWLLAFERLLARRGILDPADVEERTFEFEFGERDEVF
jgi:nitrile hydratase accessory protein